MEAIISVGQHNICVTGCVSELAIYHRPLAREVTSIFVFVYRSIVC